MRLCLAWRGVLSVRGCSRRRERSWRQQLQGGRATNVLKLSRAVPRASPFRQNRRRDQRASAPSRASTGPRRRRCDRRLRQGTRGCFRCGHLAVILHHVTNKARLRSLAQPHLSRIDVALREAVPVEPAVERRLELQRLVALLLHEDRALCTRTSSGRCCSNKIAKT